MGARHSQSRHDQQPASGRLLVAAPDLVDPSFVDSVVLLIEHNHEGAVGVVLTRPSMVPLETVLDGWDAVATQPEVLFRGGPVGTDGALALGRIASPADPPVGWRPISGLGGLLGLVDLDGPSEQVGTQVRDLRVFAGYAGWGAEQLEAEIAEGSWYVVPGLPGDVFSDHPDGLRRAVLRRQPGELAWASTRPADPVQN